MAAICNTKVWREFFAFYRSLPETWDAKSDKYKNRNTRARGFLKLLIKYQELQPGANIDDLKNKLNCIRSCYRRELKKVQKSQIRDGDAKRVYVPSLWYYNELDFLGDTIKLEDNKNIDSNTEEFLSNSPKEQFTTYKMMSAGNIEVWREFFVLYRSLPQVWDVNCDTYRNRRARAQAFLKLLIKYQELRPDANIDDLKSKLNNIRACYRRELKKVLKSELDEDGTVYVPVLWYYQELDFLRDVMQLEDCGHSDTLPSDDFVYTEENSLEIQKLEPDFEKLDNSSNKYVQRLRKSNSESDDDSVIFSKTWAALYKKLTPEQQMYANKTIMEVLYQGQMGNLNPHSHRLFESESTNIRSPIKRTTSPLFVSLPEADCSVNSEPQVDDTSSSSYSRVKYDIKSFGTETHSDIEKDDDDDDDDEAMLDFEDTSHHFQESQLEFEEVSMGFQESSINYTETAVDIKDEDQDEEVQYSFYESEERADMQSPSSEFKSSAPSDYNFALLSTLREQLFSQFIEEYKNNPCLWDTTHPEYQKRDSRKTAYGNIVNGMYNSCNYEISEEDVAKKIINLRTSYFRNVRRMENDPNITPIWYFNKMSFLGTNPNDSTHAHKTLKNDETELDYLEEDLKIFKNKDYAVPLPPSLIRMSTLTEEQDENLIISTLLDGYEKFPILWDQRHPHYRNRPQRKLALENVAKMLKKKYDTPAITLAFLKKKFNCVRSSYKREVHRLCHNNAEIISSLWYFDQISAVLGQADFNEGIGQRSEREKSEFTLDFIETYKSFPCLWDLHNDDFSNQERRKEVYNIIIEKMKQKWNLKLTFETLHKKVLFIRSLYAREKWKRESSSSEENTYPENSLSLYFNKLSFLIDSTPTEYQCDLCSLVFRTETKYKQHKYRHDGKLPYVCSICNKGFLRVTSLECHKNIHLDAKDRPFGCTFCDARFSSEINCTVHIRRHTRDYYHQCKECGKCMATSTELKTHMVMHSEERPFVCESCGKGYRTLNCFTKHRKRHLKQREFKCTMCSKSFYLRSLLNKHMKFHQGVRDKVCKICGDTFSCLKTLKQHRQLHNEHKSYVCKICLKGFSHSATLKYHMKSHGNIEVS